jgi:uncharacterized SAM-binding protein YcdF (DUF218 family)
MSVEERRAGQMSAREGTGKLQRRVFLSAAVVAAGIAIIALLGRNLGRWLVVNEPLEKADAILVLSGGLPERALEAARIYKQGYAKEVWLTHATEPGATLEKYGVGYTGEEVYDKRLLMHEGVPESAIRVLEPPVLNTADEVNVAAGELRGKPQRKIIIVTSKVHTRRARTTWKRVAGSDGTAIVRAASDDQFDAGRWWQTTTGALDVLREVLGLVNAWAGFPLQPAM